MLGIAATAVSLALAIWSATTATPTPFVGGLTVPLADPSTISLSIAGYVLTPVTTIAALAWDVNAQRRGLRDRNFVLRPRYSRALRAMLLGGFVLVVWHIANIAEAVSLQ